MNTFKVGDEVAVRFSEPDDGSTKGLKCGDRLIVTAVRGDCCDLEEVRTLHTFTRNVSEIEPWDMSKR